MLIIRHEQMQMFEDQSLKRFEDKLLKHLREFFPEPCDALGEAGVRNAIQWGRKQAQSYGFASEQEVCKYLNMMFSFGRDFDTDSDLPWVGQILDLSSVPATKLERLYAAAMEKEHEGRGFWAQQEGAVQ